RFCGIGSGLLETARASANRPLELTVQDVNIRARRFYQRLGWIDMGAEKSNRGEPSRRLRSPE
ncbi:MAG: GNAT family N-acetyltransferase, partial [Pseudomonadota bacterium]